MTRSDMEATNARRTAHQMNRLLETAFNSFWDASVKQTETIAMLTRLVSDEPDLIEPIMKIVERASQASGDMSKAQRQLRTLKDAIHEWEQGNATALMDILGVERANEPQRTRKKNTKAKPKADATETVEAPAIKS